MFKRILKWFFAILGLAVVGFAIFLVEPDLVPPLESESFLRKVFAEFISASRNCDATWLGRAIGITSHTQAERRITGASTNGVDPMEERSHAAARVFV